MRQKNKKSRLRKNKQIKIKITEYFAFNIFRYCASIKLYISIKLLQMYILYNIYISNKVLKILAYK